MTAFIALAFWILAIVIAITIHEFSHAFLAEKLGDPTARLMGRLSLNPLKHYDPVGTTMLLATAFMSVLGAPIVPIGWAKPVPYDPYNLSNPRKDGALIALAGPISNLIVATLCSLLLRLVFLENIYLNAFLITNITLSVALAVFNLIPVHPLDGSKILAGILPRGLAYEFQSIMGRYGMMILILLIFPFSGTSAIGALLGPILNLVLRFFLP
jgi:Zn-dependent protease